MNGIDLLPHAFHGEWNYTIMPPQKSSPAPEV